MCQVEAGEALFLRGEKRGDLAVVGSAGRLVKVEEWAIDGRMDAREG